MKVNSEKLVSLRMWAVEAVMGLNAANKVMPTGEMVVHDAEILVEFVLKNEEEQ